MFPILMATLDRIPTFFVPDRVILRKLSALSLSRKNRDKFSPVIAFKLRMPKTSRLVQYRAIEEHDWSVNNWQLEMSKFTSVFPAVLAICRTIGMVKQLIKCPNVGGIKTRTKLELDWTILVVLLNFLIHHQGDGWQTSQTIYGT